MKASRQTTERDGLNIHTTHQRKLRQRRRAIRRTLADRSSEIPLSTRFQKISEEFPMDPNTREFPFSGLGTTGALLSKTTVTTTTPSDIDFGLMFPQET